MNRLFLWIAVASALVLQSCEKTDGIRDEIGKLSDRVAALEAPTREQLMELLPEDLDGEGRPDGSGGSAGKTDITGKED